MCRKIRCVYRFLDKDKQVLYVGKTTDLDKRITEHKSSHIGSLEKYKFAKYIEFIEYETDLEIDLMEKYFISNLKPKYNIAHKEYKMDEINRLKKVTWSKYDKEIELYQKTQAEVEFEELSNNNKVHNVKLDLFEVLFDLTITSIAIDLEERYECDYSGRYLNIVSKDIEQNLTNKKLLQQFKNMYPNLNITGVFIEVPTNNDYPLSLLKDKNIKKVEFDVYIYLHYKGKDETICRKIEIVK